MAKTIYEDLVLRREIEMKAANDYEEKLSKDEVSMCILTMERKRVSFFADHLYPNRRLGKLVWTLTADGRRSIAHQNGLAGIKAPVFVVSPDGVLLACRVTVFRKLHYNNGKSVHLCEYHGEARWDEFVQRKRNGEINSQWKQRPYNQLAKCAEMQALRRGFPEGEFADDAEVEEVDDIPLNEEPEPSVTPLPKPGPDANPEPEAKSEPEPEPAPEPESAPVGVTIDSLKAEATPLLKAYCEKHNGGEALSWKKAYAKLAGVVDARSMEITDYETLTACLRDALEANAG